MLETFNVYAWDWRGRKICVRLDQIMENKYSWVAQGFMWKIVWDILPTRATLNKRFKIQDSRLLCPFYNREEETINHLFIYCPSSTNYMVFVFVANQGLKSQFLMSKAQVNGLKFAKRKYMLLSNKRCFRFSPICRCTHMFVSWFGWLVTRQSEALRL